MRVALYLLLITLCGTLNAQDLTGTWKGTVTQGVYVYYYEIRISASTAQGTIAGTTYIQHTGEGYYGTNRDNATMNFNGTVKDKTVIIEEGVIQRQRKSSESWYWCLKHATLKLDQHGDSLLLTGRWISTNCTPGRIRVRKIVSNNVPAQATAPHPRPVFVLNKKTTLQNVLFKQSTVELLPESFAAINSVCDYLTENPAVTIKILGHTDRIGREQDNKPLSLQRAETVRNYMVGKGIATTRISAAGFGSDSLICSAPCVNNRRVEFILVK